MEFRYPCFREFKLYAGKISAIYEIIELAVREFYESIKKSSDEEADIQVLAKKHGLHVHFKECPDITAELIPLHISNVHESFERFLKAFRIESTGMLGVAWKDYDKKSDLYVAIQNVFGSQKAGRNSLGEMQVELCEYYRLVRNAAIHSDSEPQKLERKFTEVKQYRASAIKEYETILSAPNSRTELSRDDFQLFIRCAQDVAWGLSKQARPSDKQLYASVQQDIRRFNALWPTEPSRIATAVINLISKKYGLSRDEAGKIIAVVR